MSGGKTNCRLEFEIDLRRSKPEIGMEGLIVGDVIQLKGFYGYLRTINEKKEDIVNGRVRQVQ